MIFVKLVDENGSEYYVNPNNIDCMYTNGRGKTRISTNSGVVIIVDDTVQDVLNHLPRRIE